MREQRNAYKGSPHRPWVRISLIDADGATKDLELLADTGNPCAIIAGVETMRQFNLGITPGMNSNFGLLEGGWLRVQVPSLGFNEIVLGYGSDAVMEAAQSSHSDFEGLVGLPFLQLMADYGGDSEWFWIRTTE